MGIFRNLWGAFMGLPVLARVLLTLVAVFAALLGVGLSIALSPFLALLALVVSAAVLLFRALRRKPLKRWAVAVGRFTAPSRAYRVPSRC